MLSSDVSKWDDGDAPRHNNMVGMKHDSRQSRSRRVFQQVADERDSVGSCAVTEDLGEWVRLDLWEFVLHVLVVSVVSIKADPEARGQVGMTHVRVHRLDLLPCRRSEDFDDLDQLVNT